jgi:putative transposase
VVDTLGLVWAAVVHPANIQDPQGARLVLEKVRGRLPRLQRIWADGIYQGSLVAWVHDQFGWVLDIVRRCDEVKGFVVLPHRWIVERTFGWFGRYRRMSKDYEFLTDTSEAMVSLVMIHIMTRRLARGGAPHRLDYPSHQTLL